MSILNRLALMTLLSVSTPLAFAEEVSVDTVPAAPVVTSSKAAFDGWSVQVGAGMASLNTEINQADGTYYHFGQTSPVIPVSFGYDHHIGKQFNLGGRVFYDYYTSNVSGYTVNGVDQQSVLIKNTWGAMVEPGYYLDEDTLTYGQIGWASSSADYRGATAINFGKISGVLLGFGVKFNLSERFFVGVEASKIIFHGKAGPIADTWIGAAFTQGSINFGYRFDFGTW